MSKAKKTSKKPTVRERTQQGGTVSKTKRIRHGAAKASKPLKKLRAFGKKEYNLPLPDNKVGRILSKRGRLVPRFFREAWAEIKQVTWPTRKETVRLTTAVFIFSLVFGILVALLDVGLDKIFRQVITK